MSNAKEQKVESKSPLSNLSNAQSSKKDSQEKNVKKKVSAQKPTVGINQKDVLIIIPAYNEAKVVADVISKTRACGYQNILVIDDKSTDKTAQVAKKAGAKVITHKVNLGAGGATRTGLDYAKTHKFAYVVTLDADGQHDPNDIKRLLEVAPNYDVVIGSRMIRPKGMPFPRLVLNIGGSIFTWLLYGIYVKDSQSGFKVFNKKAISTIKIVMTRFEFCSELLYRIRKAKLKFTEVPIRTIYTEYSLSKGQHALNALKMLWRMIIWRFRLRTLEREQQKQK
jgi:UDP-N-acetylglucosamine---dolichyl-phosphate N-acetylglucosaminyltransferase